MFGPVGAVSGRGVKVGVHYIAIHAFSPQKLTDLFYWLCNNDFNTNPQLHLTKKLLTSITNLLLTPPIAFNKKSY
jgi:hypothetical protein